MKEVTITILHRELREGEERDGIFGIRLFDPSHGVKISKRDVCIIELVQDAKTVRQADALQSLLDKITAEEQITWG
jgi:hypothetical protein